MATATYSTLVKRYSDNGCIRGARVSSSKTLLPNWARIERCSPKEVSGHFETVCNYQTILSTQTGCVPMSSPELSASGNTRVVELPTLKPGKGYVINAPRYRPTHEEKLLADITAGFLKDKHKEAFAPMLYRLRAKGYEYLRSKIHRFVAPMVIQSVNFRSETVYDCLGTQSLEGPSSQSVLAGFAIPSSGRRRFKNQAFSDWCDRNIQFKKSLHVLGLLRSRQQALSVVRGKDRLPSDPNGILSVFVQDFGRKKMSKSQFWLSAVQFSMTHGCPISAFTMFLDRGDVVVVEGGINANGLTIVLSEKIRLHMGDDSAPQKLKIERVSAATGLGLSGRHCKICKEDKRGMALYQTSAEHVKILHNYVCVECYDQLNEDKIELVKESVVPEWFTSKPSTPKSADSFDRLHRRMSSSSTVSLHIDQHQAVIDNLIPLQEAPGSIDRAVLEQRFGSGLSSLCRTVTPTVLFGIAYAYKREYGCPSDAKYIVNFKRKTGTVIYSKEEDTEEKGLYFSLDDTSYYHCGIQPEGFRRKLWKAAFFASLAMNKERGFISKAIGNSVGVSTIPASEPGFDKYFIGFTVCAGIQGANVYSRGLDFTRPDTRPGMDGLITTRQRRLFWETGGRRLVFTFKGLAKVFWRKREDERWRSYIARAIGMSLLAATRFFLDFNNDVSSPDMVFEEVSNCFKPLTTVMKERLVYVEIPVEKGSSTVLETPPSTSSSMSKPAATMRGDVPKPPSVPRVKVSNHSKGVYMVNGDTWLQSPGNEGVSRRALFRDTFRSDWWQRVSDSALRFMNQDIIKADVQAKSRSFDASNLVVDPKLEFDLNAFRYSSPVAERPAKTRSFSEPTMTDLKAKEFKEKRLRKVVTRESVNFMAGRVVDNPKTSLNDDVISDPMLGNALQPEIARNADEADVETNPGPESHPTLETSFDDKLMVEHPSPSDDKSWLKGHNRTFSVSVVADENSPLDETKFQLTEDTLSREQALLLMQNFHFPARSADDADIEENPGPEQGEGSSQKPGLRNVVRGLSPFRGRSHSPKPVGDAFDKAREASPSRARRLMGKIGVASQDVLSDFKDAFGDNSVFEIQSEKTAGFLTQYETKVLVGHLPSNKDWKSKDPLPFWSAVGFEELQRSLNQVNISRRHFTRIHLPDVLSLINTFFLTLKTIEVSGYVVSGLAHYVKSIFNCPHDGYGYAIEFRPESRQIYMYYTEHPKPETLNKIWWCLNGYNMVHGGIDRPASTGSSVPGPTFMEHIELKSRGAYESTGVKVHATGSLRFDMDLFDRKMIQVYQDVLDHCSHKATWEGWSSDETFRFNHILNDVTKWGEVSLPALCSMAMSIKTLYGCPTDHEYVCSLNADGEMEIVYRKENKNPRVIWAFNWIPIFHGSPTPDWELWNFEGSEDSLDNVGYKRVGRQITKLPLNWQGRSFTGTYRPNAMSEQEEISYLPFNDFFPGFFPDVMNTVNRKLQLMVEKHEGYGDDEAVVHELKHLAISIRLAHGCPKYPESYVLNFDIGGQRVELAKVEDPEPYQRGRLWICMKTHPVFHCGLLDEDERQPELPYLCPSDETRKRRSQVVKDDRFPTVPMVPLKGRPIDMAFFCENYQERTSRISTRLAYRAQHGFPVDRRKEHFWHLNSIFRESWLGWYGTEGFQGVVDKMPRAKTKFRLSDMGNVREIIVDEMFKSIGDQKNMFAPDFLTSCISSIARYRDCPDFANSCAIFLDLPNDKITMWAKPKNRKYQGMWFFGPSGPIAHLGVAPGVVSSREAIAATSTAPLEEDPRVRPAIAPTPIFEDTFHSSPFKIAHRVAKERSWKECVEMSEYLGKSQNPEVDILMGAVSPDVDFIAQIWRLIAYVWIFILTLSSAYEPYLRPSFHRKSKNVTYSEEDYEGEEPPDDKLLVCTLGTKGDQVPPSYYAQLAGHFGIKTHVKNYYHMDHVALDNLRIGDMFSSLHGYADLHYASELGYKRIFTPHLEVSPSKGMSYSLSPSTKWIAAVKFVDDWSKVHLFNLIPSILATRLNQLFTPTWRIGSLSDSDLPRSSDGLTLLKRKTNFNTGKVGWTAGSGSKKRIPSSVRTEFEEIPSGDHTEIFRRYDTVHIHGGAGTVQTAIASGANVVVQDPTLDRNYIRLPTPKDFKQPSVAPFMGWLVSAGYNLSVPIEVKCYWLMRFYWSTKWSLLYSTAYNCVKVYALVVSICNHWLMYLLMFFSVSLSFWRLLVNEKSVVSIVKSVFYVFWQYPILCMLHSEAGAVLAFWSLSSSFLKVTQDFVHTKSGKMTMIYEPIHRAGKAKFWFPFGHWSLYYQPTGEVFEGSFIGENDRIGDPFTLKVSKRPIMANHRSFPAPFSIRHARKWIREADVKPYSMIHNCSVYNFRLMAKRSIIYALLMSSFTFSICLGLWAPSWAINFLRWMYPGMDLDKIPLYHSLGFAAGVENIPFEPEYDVEEGSLPATPEDETLEPDWSNENSFEMLVDEISVIQCELVKIGIESLDQSDLEEVSMRTLDREIEKVPLDENKLWTMVELPPYVKSSWANIVDAIHHGISIIRNSRLVDCFIAWMRTIATSVYEFIFPILEALSYFLSVCADHSEKAFRTLFTAVCRLMDHVWGLESSKRVKTVWGLTGLHRTGVVGVKARLAANIAYSEFVGRTDFESDYNALVQKGKKMASQYGAIKKKNLGGPQRRPVGFSKPLMTDKEAQLLGFEPDEYVTDKVYTDRVSSYIEQGVTQGADGVFLATKMPELIAKSQHRYEPKYPILTSEEKAFAMEIAQSMFDEYPEVFANADILPPRAVHNYIKQKYSPGTPFIKPGGFKSRQAMFDAGYDKVMQRNAIKMLESGEYPVQFYHAFVKSQVVDIRKCLPPELGGKNKDVRTVVSQDLWSYYIDQCLQIERNKRINWDTYGAGIGMPLNQSMQIIYAQMAKLQKERGGRYIIADATAFDSFCKPFLFEVSAYLWELGFKDHPSGNGKNMASVLRASYQARSGGGSWIIGVTEPEYKNLVVSIPDKKILNDVHRRNPDRTVRLADLVPSTFYELSHQEQNKLVKDLELPENTTVLSWRPDLRPKRANWMGEYRIGNPDKVAEQFFKNQTLVYRESDVSNLLADVRAIAHSNYAMMSNVHPKNGAGSTGGSDTSSINTLMFKAGVIYAWCMTTGRAPKEFFKYNRIANTSDDTIWQSGGKFGLNTVDDVQTFAKYCTEVGIHLEIETTKDISKVEYLSKFVRTPTAEDSEALKAWRKCKLTAINHSNKQKGYSGVTEQQLASLNNPQFVVVQNPSAILLRRSAFRYYQSTPSKWRYTSLQRGAGHANNTAFVPHLYSAFAKEWCEDANSICRQHKIHRKFEVKIGKFGLQEIVQTDTRASQQSLAPRQMAIISLLRDNMFPSYYKVLDIHMNVAKIDPEQHSKFLRKLEKGWRGWEEILKEGVDGLFRATGAIPDEWSKKFQPSIEMLYAERPFHTVNKNVEKFVYLSLLKESTEEEITFSDFSMRVQESPYGAVCDIYHFWEQLQDLDFKTTLLNEDPQRIQGMVLLISYCYMLTSILEPFILQTRIIGPLYLLFLWSFIGLNKVYGLSNTAYWHSTGKSSREISRIMPRDPYMVTKQMCAFLVDLFPDWTGYTVVFHVHVLSLLPPFLDAIGKTWYVAGEIKKVDHVSERPENPWDKYALEYVQQLRASPTNRAYLAAKTSTGKSSWWVSALWARKFQSKVRKVWILMPRHILREEAKIPFGVQIQKLKRGVKLNPTIDVYCCTYGHALSRIQDMDIEQDICLFDEFHEETGEMILAIAKIKVPSFLLSATPVEIPSLSGSPYLTPNIDQRHPTTIITVENSMTIADMFLEAQNRYPEQCKRALIIVPTHKMCEKVVNSLNYLKVGKVSILSSRQRSVPREGIIVATPYVQTGLDITPPPKILIDSGRDIVINKGVLTRIKFQGKSTYPWTDPNINKQRIGRVGRLEPGIVFQPKSAGTGTKPVSYPSPYLFSEPSVASHFKVEQLVPQSGAVSADLPFLSLNTTKLATQQVRKSVTVVHCLALSGIRQNDWETYYTRLRQLKDLGEDHQMLNRVVALSKWANTPLLAYDQALFHVNRTNVTSYNFESGKKWCKPLQVLNGKWIEFDLTTSHNLEVQDITAPEVNSRYEKIQDQLNHYKSCLLKHADRVGATEFATAVNKFHL